MDNTIANQSDDLQEEGKKLVEEFEKEMTAASEEMISALKAEEEK